MGNFGVVAELKLKVYPMNFDKDPTSNKILHFQRVVAPIDMMGFAGRTEVIQNYMNMC